ncbi:hypothetical protein H6F86_21145 [Phormidium sp. FACHB-592]|uniref:Uncharacterized protein n=1 Tax=Stenomitos frigidus AS-A4 TaxID=2933935 RepID=A0ABV0KEU5_9CYAN|nr:hypothetical protein [Phormidium sp. FACHB-592]MBD2076342.1 hypothetical protein [Phormidium sp. FACHB-592]
MSLELIEDRHYKILGWCNVVYLGPREVNGSLEHGFMRTDGMGIYCIAPDQVDLQVQEWEPGEDKLAVRVLNLGATAAEKMPDPAI